MTELLGFLETAEFDRLIVLVTICSVAWQELWLNLRNRRGGLSEELLNRLNAAFSRLRMPAPEQKTPEASS